MTFVTTTTPDLYAATTNLEEIPSGADPLQYCDDDKLNQLRTGMIALHGWVSGVPVSETANGHFLALAAGSSAAVSVAAGVRIRQSSGAIDYSYNTGAYVRLLSKLTLASQATGDIMYASAADTWTRLAAGTNGYVLTLAGGVPTWAAAGGGGGIAAGDNVTWTGNHAWNTGTAAFANSLGVTGTLTVTGGATISTTLGLASGSAAAPSVYHATAADVDTGVYFAADMVGLTTAGTSRFTINATVNNIAVPVNVPAGSAATPSFGFGTDTNTGAYSIGADQYGISTGGTLRLTVSTTALTSTLPVLAPSGTAGAPGLSFSTETDCGLFVAGANSIALVTGGAAAITMDTALISNGLAMAAIAGTVAAAGYAFASDLDLGLYRVAANTLGITTGNFLKAEFGDATKNVALRATTATTNAVTRIETYEALCSATAAVGFGAQLAVNAANASGTQVTQGTLEWAWTNATAASEAADLLIRMRTPGTMADAAKLTSVGAWQVGAGSASLPSLTFLGDTNTGLYSSGADEISTTIGGTQRHKLGAASARWKFGAAALEDAYLVEVCTDGAGASNSMRTTNSGGVAYYYAKADDPNAGAYFAHYGSGNADTFCGGSNTNSTWLKAIGGHLSVGTNTAAKNLYLGANNVEFIQCVAGGEIKFSQMFKTVAGNEQTTIGAAGGASALPATPTKYIKFKDSAGTTLIIPAYAAA